MGQRTMSVTLTCSWCGAAFHPIPGRGKTMKYCSKPCRDAGVTKLLRIMSDAETAWLAGLFDGEGHISIDTRLNRTTRGVKIQITNTNRELLEKAQDVVGTGYITTRYHDNPRHKPTYDWHTTGRNAKLLLQTMLPWLIAKRTQAQSALSP